MQQSEEMDRQFKLSRLKHLLNTPDGEILMEEMYEAFGRGGFEGLQPHEVQYKAGQMDVYQILESMQRGDFVDE